MERWVEYFFIGLFPLWLLVKAVMQHRCVVRRYYDAIYAILRVLDLPLSDWERKYRKIYREGPYNSEEEWFGFQRGYTQGLRDALKFLSHPGEPPLHTNRLEPIPKELIHD